MTGTHRNALIVDTNVREFFRGLVTEAVANQGIEAGSDTQYYVVNLLTAFTSTEALYERTPDGPMIRPLAMFYRDAIEAASPDERNAALKRLGDIALFVCGVFPESLNRKLVDVDYYVAMGGSAYGRLSEVAGDAARWRALRAIFTELSDKFVAFVDVLAEVCEQAHFASDADVLRLYETWLKTGSERSACKLRTLGIEPVFGARSRRRH